jgi:class 3 adenylate cyclase
MLVATSESPSRRHAGAKEVVARLNELFEIVVPIVTRHGGHIDKFVGDGVLAVFGVPEIHPDHADRAGGPPARSRPG